MSRQTVLIAHARTGLDVSSPLFVAVGVVVRDGRVLVTKRPAGKPMAGYWEFPGGKIERDETARQALARELREELGIDVVACEPLFCVRHTYPEMEVILEIFMVTDFSGEPQGLEGQAIRWGTRPELTQLHFPAANEPIVDWLLSHLFHGC